MCGFHYEYLFKFLFKWACDQCTFMNEPDFLACGMCTAQRPSVKKPREDEKEKAVFTGDTLFIGDCGRPDLREKAGAITAAREELARQMYYSLREKIMILPDDVVVYPAHGAGSLCGKGLSQENSSTIRSEKNGNWSLQKMSEAEFVAELLSDQPFIPKYFPFDVGINKKGAPGFKRSVSKVMRRDHLTEKGDVKTLDPEVIIIDSRPQAQFKRAHLKNAINLMNDTKFETWLGSIVNPGEPFYLIAENEIVLDELIERSAKIGYETQILLAFVVEYGDAKMDIFDSSKLEVDEEAFTIVDIRNHSEIKAGKIFQNAIHIPLYELRERIGEIPVEKPVVVHCAGGYRSAAGSSIIKSELKRAVEVYDLGVAVTGFRQLVK